ncbi:MAG: CPBP family glutamic-type intramembrane protease [Candidatus Nanopelagicales bacterium]
MSEQTDLAGAPYAGAPVTYVEALADGTPLRRSRWGLADIAIAMLLSIFAPILVLGLAQAVGARPGMAAWLVLALMSPWIGFGLWPWLTTKLQGNGPRIDLGMAFRWSDLGWGLLGGIACWVLASMVAALTARFFGDFGSTAGDAIISTDSPPWVTVLILVIVVTLGPFFEELCFRGLAFAAVARSSAARGLPAVPIATVVSALLFTLIHFEAVRIGVLLTIGLILGLLRARTGRIGAGVVAHGINNLVAVVGIIQAISW